MRIYILLLVSFLCIECNLAFGNTNISRQESEDITYSAKSIKNFDSLYIQHRNSKTPDSTVFYANLLIEKYKENKDTFKVLECYHETCRFLIDYRQYKLASSLLKPYVENAEKYGKNNHIAKAYYHTANFLASAEINNKIANEYFNKAISIFEKTKNDHGLAMVYLRLGQFSEKEDALRHLLRCIEISERNDFYRIKYSAYRRMGEVYRHDRKEYKKGRACYKKALQEALKNNDSINIADANIELGCIDMQYNKTDSILHFYFKALEILRMGNHTSKMKYCYRHLAWYYEIKEDYKKALFYLDKVDDYIIDFDKSVIPEPILKKAEFEQKLGYHKRAANHYKNYIHLKDSLDNVRKAQEFSKLELKFELENIEKENELRILAEEEESKAALQKQKIARNFFILITIFLCLVSYLIYRNYSQKQRNTKKLYEANKKLHEADKKKLRFFTNISHELRTPLTLLISPLERMGSIQIKNGDDNLIPIMLRNGKRLKNLINQLLDISKIDNESLTMSTGLYDFIYEFKIISSMFSSMAEERRIDYQILIEPQELIFSFDKERMEHVITNLLSNAFKYTPEGGKITAKVYSHDNHLTLSIKDTGIGIRNEDIERVFDRFYQSPQSITENYEGTGLGLTIVKEYVEMHHGAVSVKSETGQGCEFIVKLPLVALENTTHKNKSEGILINNNIKELQTDNEDIESGINKNDTILIVEDNRDLRNYLRLIFNSKYTVLDANNGEVGKQVAIKENPDIIISDVMMPVCDGYCLTEYLKSNIETSHIPIILLTAKVTQNDKITGFKQGADDYIAKPFHEKELQLKVHNVLMTRKMHREKYKKSVTVNPSDVTIKSIDDQFLIRITNLVEANISNSDFTVEQFYKEAGMSQRNLFRKLKALTDMNPSQFIRTVRLKRAAQLLSQKSGTVSEIAYQTGFENLSYFTKCFKETFDKLPSEYS